jgi:hypothetical protein
LFLCFDLVIYICTAPSSSLIVNVKNVSHYCASIGRMFYVIFITNITTKETKKATKTKPAAKLTACSRLLGTPDPNAKPVFNLRPVLVVALLVGGGIAAG